MKLNPVEMADWEVAEAAEDEDSRSVTLSIIDDSSVRDVAFSTDVTIPDIASVIPVTLFS